MFSVPWVISTGNLRMHGPGLRTEFGLCGIADRRLQMKNFIEGPRVNLSVRTKLHERFHALRPFVMDPGIPQSIPSFLVVNFRVQKQLQIVLEGGYLRDPTLLDLADQLWPDVIVIFLVLSK